MARAGRCEAIGSRLGDRSRGDRRARQPRRGAGARVGAGPGTRAWRLDAMVPLDATPGAASDVTSWLAPASVRVRLPGRVALRRGSGRRTATTSTTTCCRSRRSGSRAGGSGGSRATAPPVDYERAGEPSVPARGAADAMAAAAAGDAGRGRRRADARRDDAGRAQAPAESADGAADRLGLWLPDAPREHPGAGPGAAPTRRSTPTGWCSVTCTGCGPLAGDDLVQWHGPGGRPRFANTGSWLYEPLLVHRARPPHPYWPGGAVLLEDGSDPRAIGLLSDVEPGGHALRARRGGQGRIEVAVAELVPEVAGVERRVVGRVRAARSGRRLEHARGARPRARASR